MGDSHDETKNIRLRRPEPFNGFILTCTILLALAVAVSFGCARKPALNAVNILKPKELSADILTARSTENHQSRGGRQRFFLPPPRLWRATSFGFRMSSDDWFSSMYASAVAADIIEVIS
jgi:hypothetical protein